MIEMYPIMYNDYLIYIENSSSNEDILILKFVHIMTHKVKKVELFCCRYIEHIQSNGLLYILSRSSLDTSDNVIVFSSAYNRPYRHGVKLKCTGADHLHLENGNVYAIGIDVLYCLKKSRISYIKYLRDS